jgi:predicted  nucleic acid-binding Zn-ribbon protein
MEDLNKVINDVSACAKSLKGSVDVYVSALVAMRERSLQCEAELAAKQATANEQIDALRRAIADLRLEEKQLTRQLELLRADIEKEKKQIGRERAKFRADLDSFMAS